MASNSALNTCRTIGTRGYPSPDATFDLTNLAAAFARYQRDVLGRDRQVNQADEKARPAALNQVAPLEETMPDTQPDNPPASPSANVSTGEPASPAGTPPPRAPAERLKDEE